MDASVLILIAVAAAAAIAAALWWGRRRAAGGASTLAERAPAAPGSATAAEAPAAGAAGDDALDAMLGAQTTALWAGTLSSTAFDHAVPVEHEPVMLAARNALAADPLSDKYFPRRPMLMPQLLAAVNDPDAPPLKLAGIIAQDPVLTGNILKLANSVYFRLSAVPVESIQRAVVVCGTDGLQSLAATALVQPVFRGGSAEHNRFPAVLWERCTQASIAAEACARLWCPADRQAAQLLALLSALGPLVAYRVVEDQYRAQPKLQPAPAVFLQVIDRYARAMAARIATLWQSPPRIVAALQGEQPDEPLVRALRAGELLATLSLLAAAGQATDEECAARATAAGIPARLFETAWTKLHPPRD
ncbi:MAG: HDOD domain-containing protein [Proteobacteria bacterium]|nr:HDOD domain-containing protein [Pseudomonadota bacterium]